MRADFFFPEDTEVRITKLVILTVVIFILPVIQTILLSALKFFHPIINDIEYNKDRKISCLRNFFQSSCRVIRRCVGVKVMEKQEGGFKWEETKQKYGGMRTMLKREFEGKVCLPQIEKWLKIEEINVIQYQKDDQDDKDETKQIENTERNDGRGAIMRKVEDGWNADIDGIRIDSTNCTYMMTVINHHVTIVSCVERITQLNYGMVICNHTDTRKGSMEWKGVIEEIRKLEPGIRFPNVLRYNVIRKLKENIDENWNHSEKGTELDPHSLLLDPWGPLEANANAFINSFLWDVWFHYVNIYFGVVVLGILFAR